MFPWHSNMNYPAIGGTTNLDNVTFVNYGTSSCKSESDVALTTNPVGDDGSHPMVTSNIKFIKSGNRLYLNR